MFLSWLRRRWRAQLLTQPFSEAWLKHLHENVVYCRLLTEAEQAKLRNDSRVFIAEREWEGCGGLEMTDEIRVTIAAQACLLVLGLDIDLYRRVPTILVYPSGYRAPRREPMGGGTYLEAEIPTLGEAHYGGPVILSWDEVLDAGRHPGSGSNLVFHEFAHQLDMVDGSADGTPPLENQEQVRRWQNVMNAEFQRLRKDFEAGWHTALDPYGLTNEAEFFAVATEAFFDDPVPLKEQHPQLYSLLREFYRQDPAARF